MDVVKFLSAVVTRNSDYSSQYTGLLTQGKVKEALKFGDLIIRREAKWSSQLVDREKVTVIDDAQLNKRIDKLGKTDVTTRALLMKHLRCLSESRSREAAIGAIGYLAELTRLLRRQATDMMYAESEKAYAWEMTERLVTESLKFAIIIHFSGGSHVPTSFSSRVMLLGIESWAEIMMEHASECYSHEGCAHARKITRVLGIYPA